MKPINLSKHVNTILLADDDADDRLLIKEALNDVEFPTENLKFVEDGEDLMNYLYARGQYAGQTPSDLPDLILLDLNMPKKDGREALKEIRANSDFRQIPIVVLTTSTSPQDIRASYEAGANTYISKSVTFDDLVETMQVIKDYWAGYALIT